MLRLFLSEKFIAVICKQIFILGKTVFQMKKYDAYLVMNYFHMRGNINPEMSHLDFEN